MPSWLKNLDAPLCPGFVFQCLTGYELLVWIFANALYVAVVLTCAHLFPERLPARFLVAAALIPAAWSWGFVIGAHLPRGDPHGQAVVGWLESGSFGAMAGILVGAVAAVLLARRSRFTRIVGIYLGLIAFVVSTLQLGAWYWMVRPQDIVAATFTMPWDLLG